jgi:hypothetical protein
MLARNVHLKKLKYHNDLMHTACTVNMLVFTASSSDGDEEEGVGMGKACNLFSAAAFPEVAVRALEERLVLNAFPRVQVERSMSGMHGVMADGCGVTGAGGSNGSFEACMKHACCFAGGRRRRQLRRGVGLGWLDRVTAVGGATLVGGATTVGGATIARGAVGSTVGTLRPGTEGHLERLR